MVVSRVPVAGKVTLELCVAVKVIGKTPEVLNSSAKVTFLAAVKDTVSVPPKVKEFVPTVKESFKVKDLELPSDIDEVLKVVLSFTVRVFPPAKVRLPLLVVIVLPFMLAAVTSPAELTPN